MKVSKLMLQRIHAVALANVKDDIKDRHETHEQFLARCWLLAVREITGVPFAVEVHKDVIIEPED